MQLLLLLEILDLQLVSPLRRRDAVSLLYRRAAVCG
jgi:hypothetical protein